MSLQVVTHEGLIVIEGSFDLRDARSLLSLLQDPQETSRHRAEVVVDFTRAREVTAIALGALVDHLGELEPHVTFRGLPQHSQRVLHHLTASSRYA